MQEMQRNATNTSTKGDVRDRMRAAIQNCDDILNINRGKAVIVSFYEGICSFHDDFPPHTSSHTLLWHRIDVTSWNSTKSGNQTKMDVSTRGKLRSPLRSKGYGGVSQSSENDAWSEMDKNVLLGRRSSKCCEEVILRGRFTWDLCAGRRTGLGVGRLFMIKQYSSKQRWFYVCEW